MRSKITISARVRSKIDRIKQIRINHLLFENIQSAQIFSHDQYPLKCTKQIKYLDRYLARLFKLKQKLEAKSN